MTRIGQPLAPPPSDIDEVLALGAPVDSTVPFDESMESQYAGGFDKWTSPEARRARANRVEHTTSPVITLYDIHGEDRTVVHSDLQLLTDQSLEPTKRLYVRCPKCISQPNQGLHAFAGPNACPAQSQRKWMPCPICAARGNHKRVYEDIELTGSVPAEYADDPNYVMPQLPDSAGRSEQLQNKLDLHMTAFHAGETQQMYGVRREPNGNGFRIVRGRSAT